MTFPPTLQQTIDRLRIENAIENDDVQLMMDAAVSAIIAKVGRPIAAAARTWMIESGYDTTFFIPLYPVKHTDPDFVMILDPDDVAITDFRVNTQTGQVFAGDTTFTYPLTVTATVGLDLFVDYATRIRPVLEAAFFDIVSDFYQRRSPNAFAEGAGGGVITQYQAIGIPDRACQLLSSLRLTRAH